MAASNYLLELDQRRERLISDVVTQLVRVPKGSVEHEIAVAFTARSLAYHGQLDAEAKKVETAICGVAEKLLMAGQPQNATRLLLLSSGLSGTPMRLKGHRISKVSTADADRFHRGERLVHPYSALALVLALSGSQAWTMDPNDGNPHRQYSLEPGGDNVGAAAASATVAKERVGKYHGDGAADGELDHLIDNSSKLWSTDSEEEEKDDARAGAEGGGGSVGIVKRAPLQGGGQPSSVQNSASSDGEGEIGTTTEEWLQAFQNEPDELRTSDEGSAFTDDEGYGSDRSKTRNYAPANNAQGLTARSSGDADSNSASMSPSIVRAQPRYSNTDRLRHKFGATCVGAEARSLGGRFSSTGKPLPFLRPCQTLEAFQSMLPPRAARRRTIPEAEVVRAALHMLQGLAGEMFVKVDSGTDNSGDYGSTVRRGFRRFALCASAASGLGVATLSPAALASALDDFVSLGCTAEYLRAFVADAEASALYAAQSPGVAVTATSRVSRSAVAGRAPNGIDSGGASSKHGYATQAFVACVRRQLEAFEDAVARQDRWLYRRQRGLDKEGAGRRGGGERYRHRQQQSRSLITAPVEPTPEHPQQQWEDSVPSSQEMSEAKTRKPRASSAETLLGIFDLLREEAESLQLTRRLVEAGAGWWAETPPGEGTRPGEGTDGGLRERTGKLLAVLYNALLEGALVGRPLRAMGAGDGGGAPSSKAGVHSYTVMASMAVARRRGWLLSVFCEVLAPYLRLMDTWVTEGRIEDPHGELFFSQIGDSVLTGKVGLAAEVGVLAHYRNAITRHNQAHQHARLDGLDIAAAAAADPVVHVWDTGIVLHEKATPQFLAPLASAVALAGQDISLMRRVRALIAAMPEACLAAATGGFATRGHSMRRKPSEIGTGLGGNDEALSLSQTLFDSLGHMAKRVRSARVLASPRASPGMGTRGGSLPKAASHLRQEGSEGYASDNDNDNRGGGVVPPPCDQAAEDHFHGDDTADAVVESSTSGANEERHQKQQQRQQGKDETRTTGAAKAGALRGLHVRWLDDEAVKGSSISEGEDGEDDGNNTEDDWDWGSNNDPRKADGHGGEGEEEMGANTNSSLAVTKSGRSESVLSLEKLVDERESEPRFADLDASVADGSARASESKASDRHKCRGSGSSGGEDTSDEVDRDGKPSGQQIEIAAAEAQGERPPSSPSTIGKPAETIPTAKNIYSGNGHDHSELKRSVSLRSNDNNRASAEGLNGGKDDASDSGEGGASGPDGNRGFFSGTAQLALAPDAMLRQGLHPALAPPFLPGLNHDSRDPLLRRRNRRARGCVAPSRGGHAAGNNTNVVNDADRRSTSRIGGAAADGTELAAAAEDVAEVLPPEIVLERCLLAPLRKHCQLASSSCLGAFVDELGLTTIAGVLRAVYLSPGGAKSDGPLSYLRAVLFGALARAGEDSRSRKSVGDAAVSDGVVVRDVPAFLQDAPRLTSLLHASLALTELELAPADSGEGGWGGSRDRQSAGAGVNGECLRTPVVGGDKPLLEHFFVECRPERVQEWRGRPEEGKVPSAAAEQRQGFPLTADGRCVDLRVFSCLQLECRLPWPQSVALPPRSMEKYARTHGLLMRLEFAVHVLEGSHVSHSHAQRDQPAAIGYLDKRHLLQTRLFAFLRVARALRCYAVVQALVKPWSEFLSRVPRCGSLRGFIRLHEAYLDLILERCFLLPRSRQTLAYLLDALQAGIAFSQRYGEYLSQLNSLGNSTKVSAVTRACREGGNEGVVQESLARLDELWKTLMSSMGFVLPLLKEMVRSRSGVHVTELLIDLDFNNFFKKTWGLARNKQDKTRTGLKRGGPAGRGK